MLMGLCISTRILKSYSATAVTFSRHHVRVLNMMCELMLREQYWWSSYVLNLLIWIPRAQYAIENVSKKLDLDE